MKRVGKLPGVPGTCRTEPPLRGMITIPERICPFHTANMGLLVREGGNRTSSCLHRLSSTKLSLSRGTLTASAGISKSPALLDSSQQALAHSGWCLVIWACLLYLAINLSSIKGVRGLSLVVAILHHHHLLLLLLNIAVNLAVNIPTIISRLRTIRALLGSFIAVALFFLGIQRIRISTRTLGCLAMNPPPVVGRRARHGVVAHLLVLLRGTAERESLLHSGSDGEKKKKKSTSPAQKKIKERTKEEMVEIT